MNWSHGLESWIGVLQSWSGTLERNLEWNRKLHFSGKIFVGENIRILHECQVWIDKSVPRVTFWHHEARRVMPNCGPRDRFVYPYLTQMMDSFSCTP